MTETVWAVRPVCLASLDPADPVGGLYRIEDDVEVVVADLRQVGTTEHSTDTSEGL